MPYPETIAYIKKQIEKGIPIDKIKKALTESGYQQEVIDELLEKAGNPKQEKKSSGIEVLLKDAAVGVFLLIVVGSLLYFNFFKKETTEKFSPGDAIKIDFSRINPVKIEKDGFYSINLADYIRNKDYDTNGLVWDFKGKYCINVQMSGNTAALRSVFLPGCPSDEQIVFTATDLNGLTGSGILKIKIV